VVIAMQRILVKAAPGLSDVKQLTLDAVSFEISRLFESIDSHAAHGAAPGEVWYVLTPQEDAAGNRNDWDDCHGLLQSGFGLAGVPPPSFAEPDIEQRWLTGNASQGGQSLAQSCDNRNEQSQDFPHIDSDPYWYRDGSHSQFAEAMDAIGGAEVVSRVRIAHFDTGYDRDHESKPEHLREDLGRNFTGDSFPVTDAIDHSSGLFTNLGHGTGTLGILAGKPIKPAKPQAPMTPLGAAPFAEVVPVRVADRVVLFSNSAIARAFDYVHKLNKGASTKVDIISMSMGGLASQAWADAVNALYEQGVFIVTAAGNNYGNLPTHNIVYPARFNRVVAACGVMANGKAYADLEIRLMAGNYGPFAKVETAIAASTPNVPWARFGCSKMVDFDGSGTSAATPQVAAAAAIWLQKNRDTVDAYKEGWKRVEAIRHALFESARHNLDKLRFGRGELRARAALDQTPVETALQKAAVDTVSFPLQEMLSEIGMQAAAPDDPRHRMMLELEALQLSQNTDIEKLLLSDLEGKSAIDWRGVREALISHPNASKAVRRALGDRTVGATASAPGQKPLPPPFGNAALNVQIEHAKKPHAPKPAIRSLRVYAYDPSLGAKLDTLGINEATLEVRWEDNLKPGPIGEYIEVVDVDPASQCCYAPVDLNDPYVLTRSGLTPSEGNPQFHQQMAYAVAMKTIEHFEKALGRVAFWAPREIREVGKEMSTEYVQRLRIYPHALRARNAYYSPETKALLLGYFSATVSAAEGLIKGSRIFTAVSHDVVAHETTHALLDGVHRRFREATHPDVFAFHEAFADIVALFQHFTLPEALRHQISATRGDLQKQNLLGQLAIQFGEATGRYGALRNYIQYDDEDDAKGAKKTKDFRAKDARAKDSKANDANAEDPTDIVPTKTDYDTANETGDPHAIGAVLVAAVFDAFLQIYKKRTRDLLRLATAGTGILPVGEISVDLVERLAREASKVAGQMLNICIRALDYCPPIDIRFGEYLRALMTADFDLVPYDRLGYRTAFIEAFRKRGIYPRDVKHLAPGSLYWERPPLQLDPEKLRKIIEDMSTKWDLQSDRREAYCLSKQNARKFWKWLMNSANVSDDQITAFGLIRIEKEQAFTIGGQEGELRKFEVHSVRPVRRVSPDGNILSDLVVEITQSFRPKQDASARFRGGCTLIIDLAKAEVRYMLRKKVDSPWRLKEQMGFAMETGDGLHGNYFADPTSVREPFAMIHHVHGGMSVGANSEKGERES